VGACSFRVSVGVSYLLPYIIAWITGRRRDQSTVWAQTPIFELDKIQRLKVNPLANWTSKDTWDYVHKYGVLYNSLHDQGYPSIGDQPTTTLVQEGEDERAGRWRGTYRTECGMHSVLSSLLKGILYLGFNTGQMTPQNIDNLIIAGGNAPEPYHSPALSKTDNSSRPTPARVKVHIPKDYH